MRTHSLVAVVSVVALSFVTALSSPGVVDATGVTSVRVRMGRALRPSDTDENATQGHLVGVAASARARALVVWDQATIRRSTDDGRTFAPVLAGDWRAVSVAVTDTGDVFAVRVAPDGHEHALSSTSPAFVQPPMSAREVYAAGRYVVVIGQTPNARSADDPDVLGRSADGGRTWRTHPMSSWGNFDNIILLEANGVVHHASSSEAGCGGGSQSLSRLEVAGGEWQVESWPFDAPTTMQLGPRGWIYALDDACDGETRRNRPCAARGAQVVALGAPVEEYSDWGTWGVATNGRTSVATLTGRLLRLDGPSAREVAHDVPTGFAITSVDARGNALGLLRARVVRWSPREGWRVIAE